MDLDLRGKRAIVCGSTRGIGKAVAIELALLGASITLFARDEKRLRSTMHELKSAAHQRHEYLVGDFNFPEKIKAIAGEYAQKNIVHILVNNTGGPPAGAALDATPDEFVKAFTAHLLCNHILVQAFVDGMKRERYGRVINIVSTSAKIPALGLGVSNTVRGAVANWAKTLSLELAESGITVNNVLPGATKTERLEEVNRFKAQKTGKSFEEVVAEMEREIPARRAAEPHEVAAAAAFLACPAAGYINGINMPVDGGRTGSL